MYLQAIKWSGISVTLSAVAHFSAHGYLAIESKLTDIFRDTRQGIIADLARESGFVRETRAETLNVLELIEREALRHRVSPALLRSLATVESGGNPWALSSAGAMGVLQVMPFNAKRCGLKNPGELFDVEKNIRCGAQILSEELKTHGDDPVRALQSYNGGPKCIGRCPESLAHSAKVLKLASRDIR